MSKNDKLEQSCRSLGQRLISKAVRDFKAATGVDPLALKLTPQGVERVTNLRQYFTAPDDGATGLELYAFNMAAPGISNRFSHEQMGRFLAASLAVEARALAMADPETAAELARCDSHIQSLVDECRMGDNEFMDEVGAALARVIQRRSVIVRLNHAVHERGAVDALLAEGAGQGVSQ